MFGLFKRKKTLTQEVMTDRAFGLLGSMLVDEGHERFRRMVAKGFLGFTANSVFYIADFDKLTDETLAFVKLSDITVLGAVREAKSAAGMPMVPQELMLGAIEIALSAKQWSPDIEPPKQELSPIERAIAVAAECHSVAELERAVRGFDGCHLRDLATQTVFADGNPDAELMLIGEAPGAAEDIQGKPFVGASGQLLDRMLRAIGHDRSSAYITNLLFWRPPGNRQPTPDEIEVCLPFLIRHIALVRPKALVLMGGTASKAILNTKEGILRLRGRWFKRSFIEGQPDLPIIVTFHPAFLLRSPEMKRLAWRDFLTLKRFLTSGSDPAADVGNFSNDGRDSVRPA